MAWLHAQVVKQQQLEQQVALLKQQALASQAALAAAVNDRSVSLPSADPQAWTFSASLSLLVCTEAEDPCTEWWTSSGAQCSCQAWTTGHGTLCLKLL